jgi:uncharacterized protein
MAVFERSSILPVPPGEAWAWHRRPGAFERLAPPWERIQVLDRSGDFDTGSVTFRIVVGPGSAIWVAQHRPGAEPFEWIDDQVRGPFRRWSHSHRFIPDGQGQCRLIDRIEHELPFGSLGFLGEGWVRRQLGRTFAYRHAVIAADLAQQAEWAGRPRLTIALTGASGLIGRALAPLLTTGGHRVLRLVRGRPAASEEIAWDPDRGTIDSARLEGVDAVVHLAGEPLAGLWTQGRRRRILESRARGTELLARTIAGLARKPEVLVTASAVGIYGNRGEEVLTEASTGPGDAGRVPFLVRVARAWEAGAESAERAGVRVVRVRIGLVLSPAGGALGTMLPAFRLGLGGMVGTGRQYQSWIAIDDVIGAIYHAVMQDRLRGPVNLVSPHPATNAEFTKALAAVLGRPAPFTAPAGALRLLPGGMGEELLLTSARVLPDRLRESGYRFRFPRLPEALAHVLGR